MFAEQAIQCRDDDACLREKLGLFYYWDAKDRVSVTCATIFDTGATDFDDAVERCCPITSGACPKPRGYLETRPYGVSSKTLMMIAAQKGNAEAIRGLHALGENVDALDRHGHFPFNTTKAWAKCVGTVAVGTITADPYTKNCAH